MTLTNTDREPRENRLQNSLAHLATVLVAALSEARRRRMVDAYLCAFTERELRDLGLSRDEVRANSDAPLFGTVKQATVPRRSSHGASQAVIGSVSG